MWTLGSVLFLVLFGSSVSGSSGLIISAEPGENVALPCGDTNINQVLVLEWIRTDLEEDEYVFFYRSGEPYLAAQHASFQNRVFLNNIQMNERNLSVVLTNVKIEDSGIYECKVLQQDDPQRELKLISSIRLMVIPPPSPPPPPGNTRGNHLSRLALIAVPVLIVAVVFLWIHYKKEKTELTSVIIVTGINADDAESITECIDTIQKERPDLKVEEFKSTSQSDFKSELIEKVKTFQSRKQRSFSNNSQSKGKL